LTHACGSSQADLRRTRLVIVRYLGTEVDKAIEVTEQIGADDFAADLELPKTAFL